MTLIIKTVGSILVFCAFSFFGFISSFRLKKRRETLFKILLSVRKIPEYMEIYESEAPYILKDVMPEGVRLYKEPPEFDKGLFLNTKDKALLCDFSKNFGMALKPDERKKCEAFLSLLGEMYDEALKEEKEKSKLYTVGGVLLGLTAVILLL